MKPYYEGRKEKTIKERYGHYVMSIRYFANCNKAQVSIENISALNFPLVWSSTMNDDQANAALDLFLSIGYFELR